MEKEKIKLVHVDLLIIVLAKSVYIYGHTHRPRSCITIQAGPREQAKPGRNAENVPAYIFQGTAYGKASNAFAYENIHHNAVSLIS